MPNLPKLEFDEDDSTLGLLDSIFVADCGVPSAFENALECDNCTMCCKYFETEKTFQKLLNLNLTNNNILPLTNVFLLSTPHAHVR